MDKIEAIASVVKVIAAIWGLLKGAVEFNLQGRQRRAEMFLKKQAEYIKGDSFNRIRTLLEDDCSHLAMNTEKQ